MKIRSDFVTNSSSSSYVCIAKVDLTDELRAYMKEEFGKFGERLLKEQLESGKSIRETPYSETFEIMEQNGLLGQLEDGTFYLQASFVEWSNDGDQNGEDAFLYENLPDRFKHEIYNEHKMQSGGNE